MPHRKKAKAVKVVAVLGGVAVVLTGNSQLVGNIFITAIAVLSWTFCLIYVTQFDWRHTFAGRSILYDQLVLAALSTHVAASNWVDYPFRDQIRPVLYLVSMLAVLNLLVTFLIYEYGWGSREKEEEQEAARQK
ncbi:holin [Rhodococcus phage ReqiDocB7]|uniref:holin n=1 Tax=Rhodococcus phage ReqiDocB7 TaxID=691966 RepID=UPI0001CDD760|nr:holin [Rhodococcus phage ReqiDocB7]ADD80816.1 holin [Rhodococcus phage ReqiDocB7]